MQPRHVFFIVYSAGFLACDYSTERSAIAEHSAGPAPEVQEIETKLKSLFGPTQDTKKIGQISKAVFGAAFNIKKTKDFSGYITRVAEQAHLIGNPELFLRLAEAGAIPKGRTGKLTPNKALFGKLKVAQRLDRNIQQGA